MKVKPVLKYNYKIIRDEGDQVLEYIPEHFPTELADIVYIEGPNSSGKSTLLNILALGLFGLKLKKDEIHPALKEKLENLISADHQKIQFDFEIYNEKLSISITSNKPDPHSDEFQVRVKKDNAEKIISPENFKKQFKLIYDIPDNPLERLPQLLTEIKNTQSSVGNRVGSLRTSIRDAISAVRESKDPKTLDRLHNKIQDYTKTSKELKDEIEEKGRNLEKFEIFYLTKIYSQLMEEFNNATDELKEYKKLEKKEIKDEKEQSKEHKEILDYIRKNVSRAESDYDQATRYLKNLIPNSEKHHLELWCDSNCSEEIYQPEIYQNIRFEAKYFINYLQKTINDFDEDIVNQAIFLTSLKELLSEYSHSNVLIPGINKSVNEFISVIDAEIENYQDTLIKQDNINLCIGLLVGINDNIEKLIEKVVQYKNLVEGHKKKKDQTDLITNTYRYEQLCEKIESLEKQLEYYVSELNKKGIDQNKSQNRLNRIRKTNEFDIYEVYTEYQLKDKYSVLNSEISELIKEYKKTEKSLVIAISEYERIEKKEPHKYQDYLEELEKAIDITQNLERDLLVTYDGYIKRIINSKSKLNDLSEEEKKYAEGISEFLAEKVHYIKHIDQSYLINKIDIIRKEILTDSNKRIKFADLGTGQSQSAYLEGLLSISDNRRIIALFDEVAMLDTYSLEPIFHKMKQLYQENKLILGIVVQKADQVHVKSLI